MKNILQIKGTEKSKDCGYYDCYICGNMITHLFKTNYGKICIDCVSKLK